MTQKLKEAIDALSSLEAFPEEEQQTIATGVLELVESVKTHHLHPKKENRPIWEVIDELGHGIPKEELERIPEDGATEHDHYLYGTPKKYS